MRINSEHVSLTYQPVILLAQEVPYSQYLALLAISKVCLVTSLQEAMNLVTHDFVCCHTSPAACANRGSLVLSEFVGSATDLEEGAFLVNPWDSKGCALAIKDALDIRSEEAERRWHILYHTLVPGVLVRATIDQGQARSHYHRISVIQRGVLPCLAQATLQPVDYHCQRQCSIG